MTEQISLGRHGKYGDIDFSKLKSGITKQDLNIQEGTVLANIFDSINTNKDGDSETRLDRQELIAFLEKVRDLAGNQRLSKREAKKYEIDGEKLGKNGKELIDFINKLAELTKNVKSIDKSNAEKSELITFEDGHTEEIFPDGSKIITVFNGGKTITTKKDKNGKTTEETVKEGNTEFKTEYKNGAKTETKTTPTGVEIVEYNTNDEPKSRTVKDNATGIIEEYLFEDGQAILKRKTDKKNNQVITYNGSRETTVTKKDGIETTVIKDNGVLIQQKESRLNENNQREVKNTTYNGDNLTEDFSIDNKAQYQRKVIDGKEYRVNYDGEGNTTGVIVQLGETLSSIAEKFGCTVKELIKANKDLLKERGKNPRLRPGDEIKIPGELQADEPALQGRKSKEEVLAQVEKIRQANAEKRRIAEERRREEAKIIAKGDNGYYVKKEDDGSLHYYNPQNKEISANEFKKRCPSIYKNVNGLKTQKKYDVSTIRKNSSELASRINKQIQGASLNDNTIGFLNSVTTENVAFVVDEYQKKFGVSLAKDLDDEWGLDIKTVKEHICKKLVSQAKSLGLKGIYYGDYQKIDNINDLENWINDVSAKIRTTMEKATVTVKAETVDTTQKTAGEKEINKETAKQIVADLKQAIKNVNDHDKIKESLDRIENPEIMKEVERLLVLEGYTSDDMYSPVERFMREELQRAATDYTCEELEEYVQKWIDSGLIKGDKAIQAQARMAARVICDAGDGMGTDCEKIKKGIYMIKAPTGQGKEAAKKVYEQVNKIIAKHNTFYGIGTKCDDLLDYLEGEVWDSEIKYLKGILAETDAIQGTEKAEAVHDLVEEAVSGGGTDIEYLKQALKGINSREDRLAIEEKLKEYCEKKGIKPKIEGQSYLQAVLYDECDIFLGVKTDHKEIRKFNEMLIEQGVYNEEEIINLRAEQAVLQLLEKNTDDIKDAIQQIKDPKVLAKINELLKTKGYENLDNFLNKNFAQTGQDLMRAELASNNLLDNNTAAEVAFRLLQNSDFDKRAMGLKAIRNENVAKAVDEKLHTIGSSLAKVCEQFNKEKEEYKIKAEFWDGLSILLGGMAENISDKYAENTDVSNNMYVETNNTTELTPEQQQAYETARADLERRLADLKKAYQEALDGQGAVSDFVNTICETYNIGTTREEIQARIEHDTETLRLLDLAAKGKLGKIVDGKTVAVSFEEVFNERQLVKFDSAKTAEVAHHQEKVGALFSLKKMITSSWTNLENGINSNDSKRLTVAIYDTLKKLSQIAGKELSLESFGYTLNSEGVIVDSNGKPVEISKLKEIAQQLKKGLADCANASFGTSINEETSADSIKELLEEKYQAEVDSFKDKYKETWGQEPPDELLNDYISTIETGKMVINIGVAIGAAIAAPFTMGGSLVAFLGVSATTGAAIATGIGVATASMGLNALEHSTDADGYTNSEWTADAEQAFWEGLAGALGAKVGMIADSKIAPEVLKKAKIFCSKLFNNPSHVNKAATIIARLGAAGFEVTSDSVQATVEMFAREGKLDSPTFWNSFVMSLIGNAAGHAWSAYGDIKADVDAPKGIDAPDNSQTPVLDKATSNGEAPSSSVRVGQKKAAEILEEVSDVAQNSNPKVDDIIKTENEIDAIRDRKTRRKAQHDLKEAIENLSPADRAIYERLHYEGLQKKVGAIFDRHNELSATDVRVISEYIQKTDDEALLAQLKEQLRNKELTYGGISSNYKTLNKAIDSKIELIKARPHVDNTQEQPATGASRADEPEFEEPKSDNANVDEPTADSPNVDEPNAETSTAGASKADEPEFDQTRNAGNSSAENVESTSRASRRERIKAEASRIRDVYGKKIARAYRAVLEGIATMKTVADFDKIATRIKNKFADFVELKNDLMAKLKAKAQELKLKVSEAFENFGSKNKVNGNNIDPEYRRTGDGFNPDELVRNAGNNGKPIDPNYIQASKDLRDHYNEAIANGTYADSYESYVKNMRDAHRVAHGGYDGQHTWYEKVGQGSIDVNPGQIRGEGCMISNRYREGQMVENIAKQYGDPYSINGASRVKLEGIADEACPQNIGTQHFYPDGKHLDQYFKQMHRTAQEALDLIKRGAPQDKILAKLAEHYQYAANARPFGQINNSLFMNEINTLLQKAGMKPMPHGMLDHAAQRLQPDAFKKYFIDEYKRTALNTPNTRASNSDSSNSSQRANNNSKANNTSSSARTHSAGANEAYAKFNKNQQPINPPQNGRLNPAEQYALNPQHMPVLRLTDGTIIDLNSPQIREQILNLKDGEFLTFGRDGDIKVSNSNNISRNHILITKENGQIQLKDVSLNGNTRAMTKNEWRTRAEAEAKFNKNQPSIDLPPRGMLDQNAQYRLDPNNLPQLRLLDGTIVDLRNPKIINQLRGLKDGGSITLGRAGYADVDISSSSVVSRHHLMITRQGNSFIIKDISQNGGTGCFTRTKAGSSDNANNSRRADNSQESQNNRRAQNDSRASGSNRQSVLTPEEKTARIDKLQAEINTAPIANELKTKYSDILDKSYVFKNGDSPKELRKKLLQMSLLAHPDKHPNIQISTDIQSKINELADILGKSPISVKSVNAKLDELRTMLDDFSNVALKEAEIRNLGGTPKSSADIKAEAEAQAKAEAQTKAQAEARAEASAQTKFNDYESKIKEANLDNIETQRQALQVFETKYPSTKGIPGRVNSLKELQKLINSPEYLKMDEVQRQIAELLILKSNQRLDIRDLYNDLNLSVDVKRQISIFDKCLKDGGINTVAGIYKQEDFDTLIMIAKARGVEDSVIEQMSAVFKKAQANGCMLVNNTPIDTSKAPTKAVTKNGQDYNVKVIDLSDPDVYANPEKYGLPAGTTPENIRLTVHMNDGFNKAPGREIHRLKNSDDLNLSGTITDGNNTLYGNQQVGVGLKYDQGSVSYASNYPAGTGFLKDINALANGRLNFDTPSVATFVRDRFIQRMKEQGFNISIEDYANFSKQFQGKSFSISDLSSLAKNGKININGKEIPLEIVQKTLADSTDDMMKVSYELRGKTITNGMNEINIENPEISYIYVRANSADETLESILSPETLKYAQDNNITIVFQKPKTLTNTDTPKASASKAATPKAETQASSTSSQSQRKTGFGLESRNSSNGTKTIKAERVRPDAGIMNGAPVIGVPIKEYTASSTMLNGDKFTAIIIVKSDGTKSVSLYMDGKLIENGKTLPTNPKLSSSEISSDGLVIYTEDGSILVRISNKENGSRTFEVLDEDNNVILAPDFDPAKAVNTNTNFNKSMTKAEADVALEELVKKYERYPYFIEEISENFDYENAERHLQHFETLLKHDSNRIHYIINKGYFASKDGADAMDWILQNFNVKPSRNGYISEVDMITQELTPEEILRAKSRNTANIEEFKYTTKLTDEEYLRWQTSSYKDEMYYISTNNKINEFLSKLDDSNVTTMRKLDKIILDEIKKNPTKEAEILDFYNTVSKSLNHVTIKFNAILQNEGLISSYKKAYQYLKENNLIDYKIVIIDSNKQNLYHAANIEDFFSLKQNLDEWNVVFFDKNGNYIRTDVGRTSDFKNIEEVKTSTGQIKYDANITKNDRKIFLENSSKEVLDNDGKLLYVEKYQKSSNVEGKYDIIREYPDGHSYKIGLAETSPAGDVVIEKTLVSETGVKTDYNYSESPNGSRLSYTKITDANGNVVFENKYQYKVINDKHFVTIENGVKYDIQYKTHFLGHDEIVVTRSDGTSVSISVGKNSIDSSTVLSKDLLPLLKQMPGSFYFDIDQYGLEKVGLNIDNVQKNNAHYDSQKNLIAISKEWKDSNFTFAHEFGHYKDEFLKVSSDPEVYGTFMRERKALIENQSQFESRQMNYFIDAYCRRTESIEGSISEITAEINAFLYASNTDPNIELRGQYLQQYFPETFAKIANKLRSNNASVKPQVNLANAAMHNKPVKSTGFGL